MSPLDARRNPKEGRDNSARERGQRDLQMGYTLFSENQTVVVRATALRQVRLPSGEPGIEQRGDLPDATRTLEPRFGDPVRDDDECR